MSDITVVKLGGSLLEDAGRRGQALTTIVAARQRGERLVLVHGGGKHVDAMLARLGIARKSHAGLRVTDAQTLEVVVAVLAGTVNKALVAELAARGVRAAGFSGADAGTIVAEPHPPIDGVELGHVGRVTGSSPMLIQALLAGGILPVISSVAEGPNGTLLNVNADSAAASLAVALNARSLRFLTDVAGVFDGSGNLVPLLHAAAVEEWIAAEVVSGGMRPKLEAALGALRNGVASIAIGEGAAATRLVAA